MSKKKPPLQEVIDLFDQSITILKKHSNSGKDELDELNEIQKAIQQLKKRIIDYKKKHEEIPGEIIEWDSVKGVDSAENPVKGKE